MAATWKKIVFSGSAPQFTTIELGHSSDTTISRTGSGDIAVEGNAIYRAGGTDVPVTDGGTGRSTGTTAYSLVATGTTATGAQQTLANGATTEVLVGGGASALPVWTTATGSGAPVRQTSPSLTGTLGFAPATELTIAAGAVTAAQVLHLIDTESDAASDDLVTINGGVDGLQLEIRAAHTDRTVVIKETGNILTGGSDIRLDDTNKYILFTYDGALSKWVVVGGSGSGGSGASKEVTQATHGFAIGDLLYLNGDVYTKAIASASATAEVVGIVSIVGGTDEFTLSTGGWVEGLSGLTAGTVYFLSGDTAGALTATEPTTEGYISKLCFIADSTTSGYFFNMRGAVMGGAAVTFATAAEITAGLESAKAIAPDQAVLALMKISGSNLAIGSDANGDMYYRASSALARLAKGTANFKMFMNAGATAPEWASGSKIGSFTRVLSAGNGDVAYTGVGFKPSHIMFMGYQSSENNVGLNIGFDDGTNHYNIFDNHAAAASSWSGTTVVSIYCTMSVGNIDTAFVKSFDSDGFTLTWTKVGSPTTTYTIFYMAFR